MKKPVSEEVKYFIYNEFPVLSWYKTEVVASEYAFEIFGVVENKFRMLGANLSPYVLPRDSKEMMLALDYRYDPYEDCFKKVSDDSRTQFASTKIKEEQ